MKKSKISDDYSVNDLLQAQREYALVVEQSKKAYTKHQLEMLAWANSPEDASGVFIHRLTTSFGNMYLLFVFSMFSNQDSMVFASYSRVFSAVGKELQELEKVCKKSKLNFSEICNMTLSGTSSYILQGRTNEGNFPCEKGAPELALKLRAEYLSELTTENISNSIREHFKQLGFRL